MSDRSPVLLRVDVALLLASLDEVELAALLQDDHLIPIEDDDVVARALQVCRLAELGMASKAICMAMCV